MVDRWTNPTNASLRGETAVPLQQTFASLSTYLDKLDTAITAAAASGVSSIAAGSGISVSAGTGAVTVANTGVTSVAGTANQITVSSSTGAVTLSIPSSPALAGTVTAGGFYAVGTMTLNRAGATGWNVGANINFQVDGTTYATLGIDSANGAVRSSGSFSVPTTSGYAFGDHSFNNFWRPVDIYGNSYFRIASGNWYSDSANYYFRNASSGNTLTIGSTGIVTASGNINYTSSNLVWMGGGVWDEDGGWSGIGAPSGNRILMRHPSSNAFYIISRNGGGIYLRDGVNGADYSFTSSAFYTNGRTIYAGGGAFSGGNYYAGGFYQGPLSNGGTIIILRSGNQGSFIWDGNFGFIVDATRVKNFTIQHPIKPDNYLVHACAEGPTSDVFYRGEGELRNGRCVVSLPDYFEELTELHGRSVMITPIADENGMVANLAAYEIYNGQFVVEQIGGYIVSDQKFWWRVDAIRKNTTFNVEPLKSSVEVNGFGPYTFVKEIE